MDKSQPIFKNIFGKAWDDLPRVFHKHYANKPYCNDLTIVKGKMNIDFSWLICLFLPLLKLFGVLVPYKGKDIPVTVQYKSNPKTAEFALNRTFYFPDKKPYAFFSKMYQLKNNEVIELMGGLFGWHMFYIFKDNKVQLLHKSYVLKIGKLIIPLPLAFIIGKGYAEEEALANNKFRMLMTINHRLFGVTYKYDGIFEVE